MASTWSVVVGDLMLEPTQPLNVVRFVQTGGRASLTIPFDKPAQLHRLADEEVGDTLLVVTALGPARGFLKPQEFVEFNALVSTHGVVIRPRADDITAEVSNDKIVVTRPGGLVLSSASARASAPAPSQNAEGGPRRAADLFVLDPQSWGFDRESDFQRSPDPAHHGGCGSAGGAAYLSAAQSCALLSCARLDPGSAGRARCYGGRRAGGSGRLCANVARDRECADRARRGRNEGSVQCGTGKSRRRRAVARACARAAGQVGGSARGAALARYRDRDPAGRIAALCLYRSGPRSCRGARFWPSRKAY